MLGGLPGSGKSTLASALAQELGLVVVRSDEVRKEMAGVAFDQAGPASMYATAVSVATYAEVVARGKAALGAGRNVLLDATWSREVSRPPARKMAQELGIRLIEMVCVAPREVMASRREGRTKQAAYASDAGVSVMESMVFEPWIEAVTLDTQNNMAVVAARALEIITEVTSPEVGEVEVDRVL
jgi:predicted kinase